MRLDVLRCPRCHEELAPNADEVVCVVCGTRYPTTEGVPVLLIGERTLFSGSGAKLMQGGRFSRIVRAIVPPMGHNLNAKGGYQRFLELLKHGGGTGDTRRKVLVIGAGDGGIGIEKLKVEGAVDLVNLDVVWRGSIDVIADGHDLPFADGTFDGVVLQAVLEHVLDPQEVVEEVWRVLAPSGAVYAETAFMQMVHEGAYDFTRFTDLGHRWLFRGFEEVDRGVTAGPAVTLLWAWCYFLRAFFKSQNMGRLAMAFGRLTAFWLLFLDGFLARRPGGYDAASGVYFLGCKNLTPFDRHDIPGEYRGVL